jgi:riboflavin kinase / FMN adenylyltransferase
LNILFTLSGKVEHSLGRGKDLGYPTANIPPNENIEDGLYVGFASFDDQKLPALIFIGPAITFDETDRKAEIYFLDFQGDLYGKEIKVEVLQRQRGNIKFDSSEKLVEQMKKDEEEAKKFFQNLNNQ